SHAVAIAAVSRMSPQTTSAPNEAIGASLSRLRAKARTGMPPATSLRTTAPPSCPVAPTTRTREAPGVAPCAVPEVSGIVVSPCRRSVPHHEAVVAGVDAGDVIARQHNPAPVERRDHRLQRVEGVRAHDVGQGSAAVEPRPRGQQLTRDTDPARC